MKLITNINIPNAVFYLMLSTVFFSSSPVWAGSEEVVAVTVAPVKHELRGHPIRNSGRISHKNEIRLSFKTGGLIAQIAVDEGEEVLKDQVLATLDLEEINAQQKRAASGYKKAAADLERFTSLHEDGLVSLQVLQTAQSANDSSAADLQIANFNKKLSVIRAPADGRILKRYVESAELIQPGQPVFLLASSKQGSVVRVGLIDQDIVKLSVGDPATIFLDAYPGREFTGMVPQAALSTNSGAGTFEVEILINDQGFALRSGLIARVEILPASDYLQYYIPVESVFRADSGSVTVFVLDEENSTAHELTLELVEFLTDEVVVRGSLKGSDKLIKLGAPYLSDGGSVTVVDDS